MQGALAHLSWCGKNAQLLERTVTVSETPMLHHLAINDTEDVDCHHRDRLVCGRDGPERTLVGAMDADTGYYLVPVSKKVLYGDLRVREGVEVQAEKLVRHLGKARRHGMVDSIGGDEPVKCSHVLLINDHLIELLNKSFVVVLC